MDNDRSSGQTFERPDLSSDRISKRGPRPFPARHWYALHTRSRYEKVVDRLLSGKGFETFLPLTLVRSRLSLERFREAHIPLFPGYTFVRFHSSPEDYYKVRSTTGVARVLGDRSGPVSVPDTEIESLRTLLAHKVGCSLSPFFVTGQRVIIAGGPLRGVQGEILRRKNRRLFVVKVQLIRRMLEVDLDPADLEVLPGQGSRQILVGN